MVCFGFYLGEKNLVVCERWRGIFQTLYQLNLFRNFNIKGKLFNSVNLWICKKIPIFQIIGKFHKIF